MAQQNLRTGYFLDGYTYKHKLNPAFGSDRGYFAIPVAGYTSVGIETSLALSSFLYPSGRGSLITFLDESINSEDFLKNFKPSNPLAANVDLALFSLGFNAGKSFNTLDVSLKADVRANLPGSFFAWAKEFEGNLDLSQLSFNADSRMEIAYGHSRSIGHKLRIGFKLKFLAGIAKGDYTMDKLTLDMSGETWHVTSKGNGHLVGPGIALETGSDGNITGINMPTDPSDITGRLMNYGFAADLGASYDIFDWLTVSASVRDLGFIKWNDVYFLGSDQERLDYEGMGAEGGMNLLQDFESIGEELLNFISPKMRSKEETFTDKLSLTSHIGVEARIPSYQNLSFGLLGTYRFDGPYSWWETRASINFAPFRWFSITGNYAHSTYGGSYGAALNFHPGSINLFVGVDSFKPLLNMTPQYIPIDSLNTNIALGLNIAFGKYHGRFPKKVKKQSDTSEYIQRL